MKTHWLIRAATVGSVLFMIVAGARCQADDSIFVNQAFVGNDFFIVAFIPNTSDWISLEGSSDLSTWTNVGSVATTNNVTVFVDQDVSKTPRRFYRLRRPGFTVEDAEGKWLRHAGSDYEFQLQHVRSATQPYVLSATVTVSAGQKAVSNAEADGQPLDQPDPNDFPTVAELFTTLKQAQQSGCWRVAVIYDEVHGFPAWCVIERLTGSIATGKQIDMYRITGFTLIKNGQGS